MPRGKRSSLVVIGVMGVALHATAHVHATPANKTALKKHYERFLPEVLNRCTTCHLPSEKKNPETLEEFPHNRFGARLRSLGVELETAGKSKSISVRLQIVSGEDADGDEIENETELLLGSNPGDGKERPDEASLASAAERKRELAKFLSSYRWQPFESVRRPAVPVIQAAGWARNEIDRFIAAEHEKRGLKPRPEASKEILLRRAYFDLIGLSPSPEERRAFLEDDSSGAYERLIDRLLEDPRYGERWGRHWMDIWRYSDWAGWSGGNQIRDSQPHIWRWRDWIIESLNEDKRYDQMVLEMLAADELAPADTNALRATGYLVRNYKMLSREQWLEDTVKHTAQAFLGVTMGCAKCHDHMTDPISQAEYYELRAVFEPHQVRTDRVPGELDRSKNGLVRVFDAAKEAPTYFFIRGDERKPDTNRLMKPGVPRALCWEGRDPRLECGPVPLPKDAAFPDNREFVIRDLVADSERALAAARKAHREANGGVENAREAEYSLAIAETRHEILMSTLRLERLEEAGEKDSAEWRQLASAVAGLQKKFAVLEAKLKLHQAQSAERGALAKAGAKPREFEGAKKKREEAEKTLAQAERQFEAGWGTNYTPRAAESFPSKSTGRRRAFARWLTDPKNPLTARVAVNHVWLRHFGRGIVATPENLGASGSPPSHPELLDWLAAEFMARGWSMKALHRLMLTSSTYRMASTPDEANLRVDPDNLWLWRMPSRRMDAELVRDNLLFVAGDLDPVMGGPEIDHHLGLDSRRRSVYLRIAAEKEVEFLKIFDGPAVTECYQRRPTVVPQQALALANSKLALGQARSLAEKLGGANTPESLIRRAFERVLARGPTNEELAACLEFLGKGANEKRARENLALVLLNHNEFITIR